MEITQTKFIMKNILIRKSNELSARSKVYLHIGSKKVLINGFGLYPLSIDPGEALFASHLWTKSAEIRYESLNENIVLTIKPKLKKSLALITGIVFLICSLIFLITRYRWSFLPLIPFVIYIGAYITILKDKYLLLEPEKGNC
jgi:hypothetical protein